MSDVVAARQAGSPSGYRSTQALTIAVVILLGLHVLLSFVVTALAPARIGPIGRDPVQDVAAVMGYAVFVLLQVCVFLAAATCFLVWLHRAYTNLPSLGSQSLTLMTPGRAVGGWFIPFVNLVHGYRSVHDLYLESQRPAVLPDGFVLPTRAAIVGWWWGFWIARSFTQNIFGMYWIASGLDIAAAVLCAVVVYRVHKRQRDQHDDLVRREAVPLPTADFLR
jgi:hypothetical protein